MRAALAAVVTMAMLDAALAASKLTPKEIQSEFFDGKAFTAATTSGTKFKMTFSTDGKVTREPQDKAGAKGEGTWKLTKDGFCTTWQGSKANCFKIITAGDNKWSVMKGTTAVATWTK